MAEILKKCMKSNYIQQAKKIREINYGEAGLIFWTRKAYKLPRWTKVKEEQFRYGAGDGWRGERLVQCRQ
jgi:hypothetical protein